MPGPIIKIQIANAKRRLASLLLKKGAEELSVKEANILAGLMGDEDIQVVFKRVTEAMGKKKK